MNGLQAVENWRNYFGEPKGATLGLFNGAFQIGGMIAVPFISVISDRFGRRAGIGVGACLVCIGAALQASAVNISMFVVSRGIIGAGSSFIYATGAPLIAEIAHPRQRTTATALFGTSICTRFNCSSLGHLWSLPYQRKCIVAHSLGTPRPAFGYPASWDLVCARESSVAHIPRSVCRGSEHIGEVPRRGG